MGNTHESFDRPQVAEGSSDRSFGLVFSGFFLILAVWPVLHRRPLRWWAIGASAVFLGVALAAPAALHLLNRLWTRLAVLLSRVTNPIVMGVLFYAVFTPAAFLLRVLKKDLLHLSYDRTAESYWILRVPPGPAPESMRNQF